MLYKQNCFFLNKKSHSFINSFWDINTVNLDFNNNKREKRENVDRKKTTQTKTKHDKQTK